MRKKPDNHGKSEEQISPAELTKVVFDLRERVARIERYLSGEDPLLFSTLPSTPKPEKRMGRKPLLEIDEYEGRYDRLSCWIEVHWPTLARQLANPKNAKFAAYAFVKARQAQGGIQMPPFYDDPEKYADALWAFLQSGRFSGDPRNLAAAMAGLPELSWKRSLDVGQQHPLKRPLMPQAWRDHLRRRFPQRFLELRAAHDAADVKRILARTSTDDATYLQIKGCADDVLRWVVNLPGDVQ